MMWGVDLDYARLAATLVAARKSRGWRQVDLAAAADLGEMTIQRAEDPEAASHPSRRTLLAIDKALGWKDGSCMAILQGGEPTPVSGSENTSATHEAAATGDVSGLPESVRWALSEGETLAGDVIELSRPGGKLRLIVVVQRGMYKTEEERERLRDEMETWLRLQPDIREVVRGVAELDERPDAT